MQVKDIMTPDPACCTPDSTLQRVADLDEAPTLEKAKRLLLHLDEEDQS